MSKPNALFYGDNLVWLRDYKYFPDESVDLIYLDPPFNSKAAYNVLFNEPSQGIKSQAQIKAFDDTWHWESESSALALNELAQNKPQIAEYISWLSKQGKQQESMSAYLSMMAIRLIELRRVLKQSGSIYLQCDPTASHYLKVLMDIIFGFNCFQNEIVWCYKLGGRPQKGYPRKHGIILFYTKNSDNSFVFNADAIRVPYESTGGYISSGRKIVNGKEYKVNPLGKVPEDWWFISALNREEDERLGYPTQKPLELLERIVKASSNEGDIVLDPFCGCGTAIEAAQKHKRRWLGIDVTWLAIDLVEKRLKSAHDSKIKGIYEVHGKPYDLASAQALANKSKKEFEIWAITLASEFAAPRERDGGVDGIFGFIEKDSKPRTIIIQVKGGEALNPGMVRDLIGTVKKEGAAIGLLVTLNPPTSGMSQLAVHSELYHSELWNKNYPSIQIRTVEELLADKSFDLPPTQSPLRKAKTVKEIGHQIIQDLDIS